VPISPISPIASSITPVARTGGAQDTAGAASTGAADFGKSLTGALDDLDAQQKATDELSRAAATGDLQSIEDLMIASTETQLATQLTVAVRNRAVESFNEIMRMQL
jgi:flagellar hook-basal body complex protein FliE